jgi:hypothetical protein
VANSRSGVFGFVSHTTSNYQKLLDKTYGKNVYRLVGDYLGYDQFHTFKHKCGTKFSSTATTLINKNSRCPCLHKRVMVHTVESANAQVQQWRGSDFECIALGKTRKDPYTYRHSCGHTWKTSHSSFRLSKTCPGPKCAGKFGQNINRTSTKTIRKRIYKMHGDEYKLIGEYLHIQKDIRIRHKCNFTYKVKAGLFLTKHGRYGLCPKCVTNTKGSAIKRIKHKGVTFKVQGAEPFTLKRLIQKYKPKDIITSQSKLMITFDYKFDGKRCKYHPDFYLPKKNKIIEVKSLATLGLTHDRYQFFGENLFERTQAKALKVLSKGFRFQLDLYSEDGEKIKLPKSWTEMTKTDVAEYIGISIA